MDTQERAERVIAATRRESLAKGRMALASMRLTEAVHGALRTADGRHDGLALERLQTAERDLTTALGDVRNLIRTTRYLLAHPVTVCSDHDDSAGCCDTCGQWANR